MEQNEQDILTGEQNSTSPTNTGSKIEHPDFEKLADSFMSDEPETSANEAAEDSSSSSSSSSSSASASPPAPTEAAPAAATPAGSPPGAVPPASSAEPSSPPPPTEVATAPSSQVSSQQVDQPVQPAATPEDRNKLFQDIRAKALPELEKMYDLPDDVKTGLVDESLAKVLPQQFAKLHFEIQTGIYSAISEQIPAMVQAVLEQQKTADAFKSSFYDKWPDLKGKDEAKILNVLSVFRQVNPNADQEMIINQAGALAMLQFGLDPIASRNPMPQNVAPPPAPVIHVPAAPMAASAGAPPAPGSNLGQDSFARLAEEWREELYGTG